MGLALSLFTATLWGSLPVALKSLLATMSPLTVTWYRYAFSVVLLTLLLRWRGKLPEPGALRPLALLLAIAALGFAGNNVLFLAGLGYVGPSAAQVIIQLAPVMLIVAGVVVFHEPFGATQWLGVSVLLGGVAMFFHRGLAAAIVSPGVLLIVAAAALWAGYAMAQKQLLRSLPSFTIMWTAYTGGMLMLLPAAHPADAGALDPLGWVFLLYVCLNGLVAYGSFAEAMSHWEVSRVSAVLATTPLFTPIFSELAARQWPDRIPHERLDWLQIAGGILVAGGSMLAALARNDKKSH